MRCVHQAAVEGADRVGVARNGLQIANGHAAGVAVRGEAVHHQAKQPLLDRCGLDVVLAQDDQHAPQRRQLDGVVAPARASG